MNTFEGEEYTYIEKLFLEKFYWFVHCMLEVNSKLACVIHCESHISP